MSNFKILHPYITNFSSTTSTTFNSGLTAGYGSRKDRLETTTPATSSFLQINLTAATAVDFVYIANLDLSCRLIDPTDLTVTIQGSTSSGFGTSEDFTYSVGLSDLIGRYQRDWVHAVAFTTSYQYYRVKVSSGSSNSWVTGKIWLGSAIDLGNPNIKLKTSDSKKTNGHREQIRELDFTFNGLTLTQQNNFFATVEKYNAFSDLVLWDVDDSIFDNSETVIYGKLLEARKQFKAGGQNYEMNLKFKEVY